MGSFKNRCVRSDKRFSISFNHPKGSTNILQSLHLFTLFTGFLNDSSGEMGLVRLNVSPDKEVGDPSPDPDTFRLTETLIRIPCKVSFPVKRREPFFRDSVDC